MDTDELTPMAHKILWLAEDADYALTSLLGISCSDFRDEDTYLRAMAELISTIEADPGSFESWDEEVEIDVETFTSKLAILQAHIAKTLATPIAERGKPPF